MSFARTRIARDVSETLIRSELKLDEMIASHAELGAKYATARVGAGLALEAGQTIFDKHAEAGVLLVKVRRLIGECHGDLAALARSLGVSETMVGGGYVKPREAVQATAEAA
jgi:hypothetical protein